MVGSLQTMGKGKLDLVKECRILGCPSWRQGISNLFKIVNEKKKKNILLIIMFIHDICGEII